MKILKLYSDRKNFNTICFNENGFSFICGIEADEKSENTYNGVGKTLSLALIDFCLGSNVQKGLSKLNCTFFLDIKIDDKIYTIKRETANQSNIEILSNEKTIVSGLAKVKNFYMEKANINEKKEISFRSILPYFLRYKKSSFLDSIISHKNQTPYNQLLNVFYLLGFKIDLIKLKKELNSKIDNLKKSLKNIEDIEIKKTLNGGKLDAKIEIDALKIKLKNKQIQLKNFKLASNLSELKKDLYKKREELQDLINYIFITNKKVNLIAKSLNEKVDIELQDLKQLYDKALVIFPNKALNIIEDVENFHKKLIENRKIKLESDKKLLTEELNSKIKEKKSLENNIDYLYNLINQKGDLKELNVIIDEISKLNEKINKFKSYANLVDEIKREKLSLNKEISENNIEAQKYIDSITKEVENINSLFTKLINNFYSEEYAGGISINVNTKNNDIQFTIDPKISFDSSTGISSAKIMCFDTLLLFLNNVNINFSIHDSVIFHGVDSNKFSNFLRYLYDNNCNNYQFIFSINQNDINEIKSNFSDNDYKKIIEENIVIQLNGSGEKGYLIGEKLEIKFEDN